MINIEEFHKLPKQHKDTVIFKNTEIIKEMFGEFQDKFIEHERKDWYYFRVIGAAILFLTLSIFGGKLLPVVMALVP